MFAKRPVNISCAVMLEFLGCIIAAVASFFLGFLLVKVDIDLANFMSGWILPMVIAPHSRMENRKGLRLRRLISMDVYQFKCGIGYMNRMVKS